MPDENQWHLLAAARLKRCNLVAYGALNFVIDRILAVAGLLVGGGVAKSFDDIAAQPLMPHEAGVTGPTEIIALMLSNRSGPEHGTEVDKVLKRPRHCLPQPVLHFRGKIEFVAEGAVNEDNTNMPRHAALLLRR